MTRAIRVLEDGTRVYKDGHRYKPKAPHERKYAVRKPDHPDAVRHGGTWYLPLPLLADEERELPATRPDEETLEHRAWCRCEVCSRPQAQALWRRQMRAG